MEKTKNPYYKFADYVLMAMIASMGIAVKVIIVPLAHILTGPLFIPGGVVAGGFYMAFLVLGEAITQKHGTATIIALIQAVAVLITGTLGSHGAASLFTYTLPGIAIDLLYLLMRNKSSSLLFCFLGGVAANITGSLAVNLAIFNLSLIPLMLSLFAAALSGGIGGIIAYKIASNLRRLGILGRSHESADSAVSTKQEIINETIGDRNEKK